MDFAAVLPPLLLAPQPQHAVLDMCAAPGGKSLVLALQLLKGAPAQQPDQSSSAATGLTTGLLEHLALQEQLEAQHQPLQDQGCCQVQQEAEQEQEPQQQSDGEAAQQHAEPHAAGNPPAQQQLQEPASEAADAEGSRSSSDAGSDDAADAAAAGGAAAPGGHASGAQQPGRLVCNELDPVRRQRLGSTLAAYLPGSLRRRVRLTGHDAAKHWATYEAGMYDRVLLDAPCSAERLVVQQAVQSGGAVPASSWSRERCKQLAALQLKMLLGGLRALKPGGRLVYSTCSIAEAENDGVVCKALQQQGGEARVVPVDEWGLAGIGELTGGQRTQHGLLCLPDEQGWGPVYLAVLEQAM
ncbi:S-adenosyl-L-methionine-dependent methyltransferase [Scenedesmus sp. NREL 46B-D3]|nr:S-adenosyl-L-methionine-dependent methyltransferase [Scenedesmus sp. NREL 46B-D3]